MSDTVYKFSSIFCFNSIAVVMCFDKYFWQLLFSLLLILNIWLYFMALLRQTMLPMQKSKPQHLKIKCQRYVFRLHQTCSTSWTEWKTQQFNRFRMTIEITSHSTIISPFPRIPKERNLIMRLLLVLHRLHGLILKKAFPVSQSKNVKKQWCRGEKDEHYLTNCAFQNQNKQNIGCDDSSTRLGESNWGSISGNVMLFFYFFFALPAM